MAEDDYFSSLLFFFPNFTLFDFPLQPFLVSKHVDLFDLLHFSGRFFSFLFFSFLFLTLVQCKLTSFPMYDNSICGHDFKESHEHAIVYQRYQGAGTWDK